jgi:hypothetical protein
MIFLSLFMCKDQPVISNLTRPGGYAMGDSVRFSFSVTGLKSSPDSLVVKVFEKKTGYLYHDIANPEDCDDCGRYECHWDGRKPDGSWPAGGRYWVFAIIPEYNAVSDTVEIGLTD